MIIKARHAYAHPVAVVMAAFTDRDFYEAKFSAVGARHFKVLEERRTDDGYHIVSEREVPLEVPSMLKSFLGSWNRIHQSETWEEAGDEWVNELAISAAGVPVALRGSMMLRPQGDGCVNEIEMEITSSVPLVGGKLVDFVAQNTRSGLDDEYAFIRGWLDRPSA